MKKDAETKAYAEQDKYIKRIFGAEAARMANYGWGVSSGPDGMSIATKIYGNKGGVLVTDVRVCITHSFHGHGQERGAEETLDEALNRHSKHRND